MMMPRAVDPHICIMDILIEHRDSTTMDLPSTVLRLGRWLFRDLIARTVAPIVCRSE